MPRCFVLLSNDPDRGGFVKTIDPLTYTCDIRDALPMSATAMQENDLLIRRREGLDCVIMSVNARWPNTMIEPYFVDVVPIQE